MLGITRRRVLQSGGAAGLLLLPGGAARAEPTWNGPAPEPGASIRVLRWKQFIQAEFDSFVANTRKFSEQTGVKVRVDAESWDDLRPKAAVAANVGAGPDIIMGTLDDPFKFNEKLIDLTDLAEYLGAKYGGWYPVARKYGTLNNRWIALPQGASGGTMNYRVSSMHAAGFDEFPKDTAGFLKLCQGLKQVGKPPGFALGHALGDANGWCQWCLWASGGKTVDDNNNVVLDSPETVSALEYAKLLYATYIDGVLSWLDPSNNKAFLADQISLTFNGISIYTVAKNSPDPALNAIAADMDADRPDRASDRGAEHPQHLRLCLLQISERGARISALHVGEGAGRLLGDPVERLYRAAAPGLERQSGLDRRSEGDSVPRRAQAFARRRLFGQTRLRVGRRHGRFRRRRHVRRGVHRKQVAEGRRA
jgi:multiple sugar transport system substrate-binding protein